MKKIYYILLTLISVSCSLSFDKEFPSLNYNYISNSQQECEIIPPFRESWCVFITDFTSVTGYISDTGKNQWAFAGIESINGTDQLNGLVLEVWATDVQNDILPVPTEFVFMTDQMMDYLNSVSYQVLIENDFTVQWQNTFGNIDPSMSGKYMYVKMRLKNSCGDFSEFITVGCHIDSIPGNI